MEDRIKDLENKIKYLENQCYNNFQELSKLKNELFDIRTRFRVKDSKNRQPSNTLSKENLPLSKQGSRDKKTSFTSSAKRLINSKKTSKKNRVKRDFEAFIGESIISKVGILITILGVGVGVKYSIEHDLIAPIVRILLGYVFSFILLGVGVKLKLSFKNYSAVLVSGSVAIFYMITYMAYDFYELFGLGVAFSLMLLCMIFTLIMAVVYNRQVISLIGLVGSYAIPILLSNDQGNLMVLLGYIAFINLGVLILSFKKNWKLLYYSAFVLTWFLFLSVNVTISVNEYFYPRLVFLLIFFMQFYVVFISYKLVKNESFSQVELLPFSFNSMMFYSIGYYLLDSHQQTGQFLGVFTLITALFHFVFSFIVYKRKLASIALFNLLVATVIVFVTIAIAVQLDGKWVTILWALEALVLFLTAMKNKTPLFIKLSIATSILTFFSLMIDWLDAYSVSLNERAFFNGNFLTTLMVVLSFVIMAFFYYKKTELPVMKNSINRYRRTLFITSFVVLLLGLLLELNYLWNLEVDLFKGLHPSVSWYRDTPFENYRIFSFVFLGLLYSLGAILVSRKFSHLVKYSTFSLLILVLNLFTFFIIGLWVLSELRLFYLEEDPSRVLRSPIQLYLRYFIIVVLLVFLYFNKKWYSEKLLRKVGAKTIHVLLAVFSVWLLSSELLHWLDVINQRDSYKFALTALWGICGLSAIFVGMVKGLKHLRVGAMVFFVILLFKLFLYDIAHLTTLSKTVIFIVIGVILLLASFLYNRFNKKSSQTTK